MDTNIDRQLAGIRDKATAGVKGAVEDWLSGYDEYEYSAIQLEELAAQLRDIYTAAFNNQAALVKTVSSIEWRGIAKALIDSGEYEGDPRGANPY